MSSSPTLSLSSGRLRAHDENALATAIQAYAEDVVSYLPPSVAEAILGGLRHLLQYLGSIGVITAELAERLTGNVTLNWSRARATEG